MERTKVDWKRVKENLPTMSDYLNDQYGKKGTPEREQFNKEALSYYYGELIKESRILQIL